MKRRSTLDVSSNGQLKKVPEVVQPYAQCASEAVLSQRRCELRSDTYISGSHDLSFQGKVVRAVRRLPYSSGNMCSLATPLWHAHSFAASTLFYGEQLLATTLPCDDHIPLRHIDSFVVSKLPCGNQTALQREPSIVMNNNPLRRSLSLAVITLLCGEHTPLRQEASIVESNSSAVSSHLIGEQPPL
ncbi:hypothetical protein ACFXTO_041231 [Malus domestica]